MYVAHFEGAGSKMQQEHTVEIGVGFVGKVKRVRGKKMWEQERKAPKGSGVLFHVKVPKLVSDRPLLSCNVKRGCSGGQLRVEVDGFGGELYMGCGGRGRNSGLKLVSSLSDSGSHAGK